MRRVRLLGERLQQVREGVGRSITEQVERAILIMGTLDDVIADPLSMGGRAALDEFIAVTAALREGDARCVPRVFPGLSGYGG